MLKVNSLTSLFHRHDDFHDEDDDYDFDDKTILKSAPNKQSASSAPLPHDDEDHGEDDNDNV